MGKLIKKAIESKDKLFDWFVDLGLDIVLILVDVLSSPIVLPARLAAHVLKKLVRMGMTRKTRRVVKGAIYDSVELTPVAQNNKRHMTE